VNTGGKAELALWVKDRDAQVLLRDTEANEKAKYDALVALDAAQDKIIKDQTGNFIILATNKKVTDNAAWTRSNNPMNRAIKE